MTRPHHLWHRRFRGGPLDGEIKTVMGTTYYHEIPPELEDSLKASIEILERGMAVLPRGKIAIYELNHITGEFELKEIV